NPFSMKIKVPMFFKTVIHKSLLLLMLCSLPSGCLNFKPAVDTSRFYVLRSVASSSNAERSIATPLVVGKVTLPDYMDRAPIVTLLQHGQLNISESNRWAEDITKDVTRVMVQNFIKLINSDRVALKEQKRLDAPFYELSMTVLDFIYNTENKKVILEAKWTIADSTKKILIEKVHKFSVPAEKDYPAIVDAMSQSLSRLCSKIIREIELPIK
ncbi:MAG: hypothetical protein A2007_04100, partial [Verrucomicrobia bacterium GWC2_42_7]